MTSAVGLAVTMIEGQNLLRLIDEFLDLLMSGRDDDDPGIERLTPPAYQGDDDAAAGFRESTRVDLLDRRVADAFDVRAALQAFDRDDVDPHLPEALAEHEVTIPRDGIDAWLRTLSAMRLVVASRLGIQDSDTHDPRDERYAVYDWLGYRLDQLVTLADQTDGD